MKNPYASKKQSFLSINRGYNSVFKPGHLSVGVVIPIETYDRSPVPSMTEHIERVQLAEKLGFSAVWLRDVPFNVPSFGDAGQVYDPFVYLGLLAGQTKSIALGTASIVLPLRHPAQVAKAAATADLLSGGRLILGVASGDRPEEYPAFNIPYAARGERFRESVEYIQRMAEAKPQLDNMYGSVDGTINMLPKPVGGRLPILITGASQQSTEWLAENGDGWMTYPRAARQQALFIDVLRKQNKTTNKYDKPFMEPLYVDLADDPETPPSPIHLGYRLGANHLHDYLQSRQDIGVNHVALNLRFNQANIQTTMRCLADRILPDFAI